MSVQTQLPKVRQSNIRYLLTKLCVVGGVGQF